MRETHGKACTMHALSVCQPYAERIATGSKRIEYRTWRAPSIVGSDLLIVASKKVWEGYAGEPTGVAVCVVRVVKMGGTRGAYEWHVEGARRVAPFAVRGYAGLFKVPDELIRYVKPLPGDGKRATARAPRREKTPAGPYTFSINDRPIAGESAATPEAARSLASQLAKARGVTITIERDGYEVSWAAP